MKPSLWNVWILVLACWSAHAQNTPPTTASAESLETGFRNPPASARPHAWWHWMNGNVTKEGITLDLEWMQRIGIAGFEKIDVAMNTPQLVNERLEYMSPDWKNAVRHTATLADKLGLEMGIGSTPGWSETGGPWVDPNQAMKKLVWSETRLRGDTPFRGKLPRPPSIAGPFQNIPYIDIMAVLTGKTPAIPPRYYADAAVVAFRIPDGELAAEEIRPLATSSAGEVNAAQLSNGDFSDFVHLPVALVGREAWIQFEYSSPQTIQSVTIALGATPSPFFAPPPGPKLLVSDDGTDFREVITMPGADGMAHTVSFSPVSGRYFRVTFPTAPQLPPPFDFESAGFKVPPPPMTHDIAELALHAGPRVHHFEEKAGFIVASDLYSLATPAVSVNDAVHKQEVIDLTSRMSADGSLDWTPPPGEWLIQRFGYSLTGKQNSPAPPEATGLEVDKLSAEYVLQYMDTYLNNYQAAVGDWMGKRGVRYLGNDSWEAGPQNWTDKLPQEFEKRTGYSLIPWLPALTGHIVESSEASDRFLWDFRQTLGDLLAENHYGIIESLLKKRGMTHYSEAHESGRAFIGDGMEVKRGADVPMGAMWALGTGDQDLPGYNADLRESASVAHIYGQNLVAAESLTTSANPWAWSPELLKPTVDKEFAMGVNRIVIHTSVHQPLLDKAPGVGLGPVGQWFTRNETWAELARPWIDYIARTSYMMQQGLFVADIAYFYGEDSNVTALFSKTGPIIPRGYNFDYINSDALLHRLSFRDARLTTPSGMTYRLLVLDPNSRYMSLPVLRKLRELVIAGAIVAGPKPLATPSLRDDVTEFISIANELWASEKTQVGGGIVFATDNLTNTLEALKIQPDFQYTEPNSKSGFLFVHRNLPGVDIYYVDSRSASPESVEVSLRVSGKLPELWHADTGTIEPAQFDVHNGRTRVSLSLDPFGSVLVVFRKSLPGKSKTLSRPSQPIAKTSSQAMPHGAETTLATITGPWTLRFQPTRGTPPESTLTKLESWTDSAEPDVKYYSGTGIYTASLNAPAAWFARAEHLFIDLGDVQSLAQLSINGKPLGILWKKPFRADITAALRPGANNLIVEVTNLWANRIIGDQRSNGLTHYTLAIPPFYKPDSKLLPSGLLGPVTIMGSRSIGTHSN